MVSRANDGMQYAIRINFCKMATTIIWIMRIMTVTRATVAMAMIWSMCEKDRKPWSEAKKVFQLASLYQNMAWPSKDMILFVIWAFLLSPVLLAFILDWLRSFFQHWHQFQLLYLCTSWKKQCFRRNVKIKKWSRLSLLDMYLRVLGSAGNAENKTAPPVLNWSPLSKTLQSWPLGVLGVIPSNRRYHSQIMTYDIQNPSNSYAVCRREIF